MKITKPGLISFSCFLLATTIAVREYTNNFSDNGSRDLIPQDSTPRFEEEDSAVASIISQEPIERQVTIKISQGDTMMSVLANVAAFSKEQSHAAIESLKNIYNPKALKVGQEICIRYKTATEAQAADLLGIEFKTTAGHNISLLAEAGQFVAKKHELQLIKSQRQVQGKINSSFYSAALRQGVPAQIIKEAISALSYDINWQHDPKAGDEFEILYDVHEDKEGNVVKVGDLKYAGFAPNGAWRGIYAFQAAGAGVNYFNDKGESVVRSLLQTPVDPTKMRITSRFGRRNHPMLGYTKMHKGVDFGAPAGTPVMASGEGVVVKAGWNGAYGNYVLVRHNSEYSTAYAHLSKVSVKAGQKVKQRQIIGNVGSTGRSTGPHLHYEVIYRGQHINPQSIKQLPTAKLVGKDLARFQQVRAECTQELGKASSMEYAVASVPAAG